MGRNVLTYINYAFKNILLDHIHIFCWIFFVGKE